MVNHSSNRLLRYTLKRLKSKFSWVSERQFYFDLNPICRNCKYISADFLEFPILYCIDHLKTQSQYFRIPIILYSYATTSIVYLKRGDCQKNPCIVNMFAIFKDAEKTCFWKNKTPKIRIPSYQKQHLIGCMLPNKKCIPLNAGFDIIFMFDFCFFKSIAWVVRSSKVSKSIDLT